MIQPSVLPGLKPTCWTNPSTSLPAFCASDSLHVLGLGFLCWTVLPHAVNCIRFCFWRHGCVFFVCVWNVSGGGDQCTKFTRKMCLVSRSDTFEGQGHQKQKTTFFDPLACSLCLAKHLQPLVFVYVWNISETAEQICAKFTQKTCLVPRLDEFEGQGHQGQKLLLSAPFSGLRVVYVW